jgi:transposase
MEASGGEERQAFALLWGRNCRWRCWISFRTALCRRHGIAGETDRIDPDVIAWFAAVKESVPGVPLTAEHRHLQALVTRLRQLTALQAARRNQRRLVSGAVVLSTFQEILSVMALQIRKLEATNR